MVTELSILIPVYNYDVRPLVQEIYQQCQQLPLSFEILLYDDGSAQSFKELNQSLSTLPHVRYIELPHNIGRSSIRNRMVQDAAFKYLLAVDNDCMPTSPGFIAAYVKEPLGQEVVFGGVTYTTVPPDVAYKLHWKYGQRASKPAATRRLTPYQDIYMCNLLVPKDLMLRFPLREFLKKYGHEDTILVSELKAHQIPVKHIENPVKHHGLESTPVFLAKTAQAIENLVILYKSGEQLGSIKLLKAYQFLHRRGLLGFYAFMFRSVEKSVHQNLRSPTPSLFLFDLYRLFLFNKKMQDK